MGLSFDVADWHQQERSAAQLSRLATD